MNIDKAETHKVRSVFISYFFRLSPRQSLGESTEIKYHKNINTPNAKSVGEYYRKTYGILFFLSKKEQGSPICSDEGTEDRGRFMSGT